MRADLKGKVLGWLGDNGYPFEMRVARDLIQNDFIVTQSAFYEDFETSKPREIDIIGRLYSYKESEVSGAYAELETFITVECKSVKHPWIIFCETKNPFFHLTNAIANKAGERLIGVSRGKVKQTKLVSNGLRAGSGVAQTLSGNKDVPFKATMSALKAAEGKARLSKKEDALDVDTCLAELFIPVVAITAPLFECKLDYKGNVELTEVERGAFVSRYPREGLSSTSNRGTVVHVVTEKGWKDFMKDVKEFHNAASHGLKQLIPNVKY